MDTLSYIINIPHNYKGTQSRAFLDAAPDYPTYCVILYLLLVHTLPGYLERRPSLHFNIKYIVAAWNLFVSVTSFIGSLYCIHNLYDMVVWKRGWYSTVCTQKIIRRELSQQQHHEFLILNDYYVPHSDGFFDRANIHHANPRIATYTHTLLDTDYTGAAAFYTAYFMYLKTPELLDTVFLILQRKPVSFLHWFHHFTTAIYCWHASYVPVPSGVVFSSMNFFVHSIMYFYYFAVVMGMRKKIRWFAPVITLLQVLQMFIAMGVTIYTYLQHWLAPEFSSTLFYQFFYFIFSFLNVLVQEGKWLVTRGTFVGPQKLFWNFEMENFFSGCDTDRTNMRIGMVMYAAYCVLFASLFKELYLDKRVKKNSLVLKRKEQKHNEEENENKTKKN